MPYSYPLSFLSQIAPRKDAQLRSWVEALNPTPYSLGLGSPTSAYCWPGGPGGSGMESLGLLAHRGPDYGILLAFAQSLYWGPTVASPAHVNPAASRELRSALYLFPSCPCSQR